MDVHEVPQSCTSSSKHTSDTQPRAVLQSSDLCLCLCAYITVKCEVSALLCRVKTPNYELYGAMTVDIRVGISGEGWTVNKIQFTYFANTSAKNCLAYGPGLLPQVCNFHCSLSV